MKNSRLIIPLVMLLSLFTLSSVTYANYGTVVNSSLCGSGSGNDSGGGNNNTTTQDDLTIKSCNVKIVNETSFQHSVQKTLARGQSFVIDVEARVKNKSDLYDIYNVDIDYRIRKDRNFDTNDTRLDDNEVDIPAGDTITEYLGRTTVKVSSDGKTLRVSKQNNHKTFNVINGKVMF